MPHTDTGPDAAAILIRARDLVLPELRTAVARLDPALGTMAGYHFGWNTADGRPATAHPGKLLRPALTVLAAEAVGGLGASVTRGAVAVELVHNFSLIHDDIMDRDELRRGRPTLWRCFDIPFAIMVGDALHALAFELLSEQDNQRASQLLGAALRDLVSGQARDMEFSGRSWQCGDAVTVGVDEYREMAMAKTGALMSAALSIGAELGGARPEVVATFTQVGRHLGLAFQCVDDILGIWGDEAVTGKPALGDLREGKRTLPLLGALATPDGEELAGILAGSDLGDPDLRHAAKVIERAGGRALTEREVDRQIALARALLAEVPTEAAVQARFDALCAAAVRRVR
ncbi:polyprenyl synthetase family protein [Streptomyces paludis]|nr:polyprenyl synthetase family protein [Streptomyces paludis]